MWKLIYQSQAFKINGNLNKRVEKLGILKSKTQEQNKKLIKKGKRRKPKREKI